MTVTFTDLVNKEHSPALYDIEGSTDFEFKVDETKLNEGGTTDIHVTVGDKDYTFTFPKKEAAPVVKGIKKTEISYNKLTREIKWKIDVGTDAESQGMALDGVIIEDTLPKDYIDIGKKVFYSVSGDTAVEATVDGDGKFSYTFPNDGTYHAPTSIEVKAVLKDAIFVGGLGGDSKPSTLSDVTITNKASMKVSADAVPESASANKTFQRKMLSKNGKQISATTTQWTINVNEGKNPIYKAVVTDRLDENIKLVGTTVKVGNTEYTVKSAANNADAIEVVQNGQELKVYFNSPFYDAKTITFQTEIKNVGDLTGVNTITNSASIEWTIPEGDGPGTNRTDWGIPGIDVNFGQVMVTKDASFDKSTGEITWKIHPTTRFLNNTEVYLVDTIDSDQEFVTGSLMVSKNGVETTGITANTAFNGSAPNNKIWLTTSENVDEATINNTVVTYRTRAKYYGDNRDNHTYQNTVTFHTAEGEDTDSAQVKPTNNVLRKSAVTEWDETAENKNQMAYTITLNQEKMNLSKAGSDLIITDDVSNLFQLDGVAESRYSIVLDKFAVYKNSVGAANKLGMDLVSSNSAPTTAHASYDGTNIKINLGDSAGTDTYIIKIYAAIDSAVFETDFGGKKLTTANTVTASGGNLYGVVSASSTGSTDNSIGNEMVSKRYTNINSTTGEQEWEVVINPRESTLSGPLIITDTLAPGINAEFDIDSVEVYKSTHDSKGAVIGLGSLLTEGVSSTVSKNAGGGSSLIIQIANATPDAYTIHYKTVVTGAVSTISNHVKLEVNGVESASDSENCNVNMSGSASGSTRASLAVEKVDENDHATKIAGATFGLYASASATTPLLTDKTDADGKLTFGSLRSGKTYYLKEIEPAAGYVLKSPNNMIEVTVGAAGTVNTTQFTNQRKSATVTLKKINEDDETLTGAKFKLYYQKDASTVNGVKLTGNAFDSYVAEGNATEVTVTGSNGLLSITDLPIGNYYFIETESPIGYSTPDTHFAFEIVNDTGTNARVVYGSEFHMKAGVPTIGEVINKKAILRLHKVDSEDLTKGLTGAKFKIEQQNGSTWTTQVAEFTMTSDELGIGDLPYGKTYRVVETAAPTGYLTPSGNAAIVAQFSLSGEGVLTFISGNYVSSNSLFTVSNDAAYADVKLTKKDSRGAALAGVTFSLYQKMGAVPDTSVDTLLESGLKTDASGILTKTHLKGGSYYFVETATVSACILDNTPIEFTVNQSTNGTTIALNMVNQITEVKFDKKDKKGVLLAGAQMQLTDAAGNVVAEFVTSGSTDLISGVCVCGETYTLTEIKAPKGYKKAKPITFSINAQGRVVINGAVQDGNVITMIDQKLVVTTEDNDGDTPTDETQTVTKNPPAPAHPGTSTNINVNDFDSLGPVFGPNKNMTYSQYMAWVLGQAGSPNTGDDSPWMLYLLLMLGALLTGGAAVYFIRKDSKKQSIDA